jgi:hypothetical protein
MLLLELTAKKPTTMSPAAVVVTEGARIDRLEGAKAPLCESTGACTATPLTSTSAPAAATDEANSHV